MGICEFFFDEKAPHFGLLIVKFQVKGLQSVVYCPKNIPKYTAKQDCFFWIFSVLKEDIFIAGILRRWDAIFVKYLWTILTLGLRDAGKNALLNERFFF